MNVILFKSLNELLREFSVLLQILTTEVFACSNAGIVGSNPTQGMDVCLR
jgi:hypothetical protein